MALAGVEGKSPVVHGLRVELGEGVGGAAEGGVEGPVGLVQRRCRLLRFPFPRHHKSLLSIITQADQQFRSIDQVTNETLDTKKRGRDGRREGRERRAIYLKRAPPTPRKREK